MGAHSTFSAERIRVVTEKLVLELRGETQVYSAKGGVVPW